MSKELSVVDEREVLGKYFKMYGDFENPLFLAKDVKEWIEHTDTSMMLQKLDEDEKLIQTMLVSGQKRDVWFLTEDGLYEVLMLSRKPIAKQFKKEVKTILKSVRKTGMYATDELLANPDLLIKVATQLRDERNARIEAQAKVVEAENQIKEDAPKVDFYNTVTESEDLIDMSSVAKLLDIGIGRNKLFEFLRHKKVLMSNNIPYQKYIDASYFRVIESSHTDSYGRVHINLVTLVFQKGVDYINRLVLKEIRRVKDKA